MNIDEINLYNNGDGTYSVELYMIEKGVPCIMKIPKANMNIKLSNGVFESSMEINFDILEKDPAEDLFVAHAIKST